MKYKFYCLIFFVALIFSCTEDNKDIKPLEMPLIKSATEEEYSTEAIISNSTPEIGVFPNPFINELYLYVGYSGTKTITIIHENGQSKVFKGEGTYFVFDGSAVKPGYLYVEIEVNNNIFRKQILKLDE